MATPPDFSVGQVLTSAVMNQLGLWLVKTQTIGSAVSSVTVTAAFSADYDNYLVTINGGSASAADVEITLAMGSTTTNYKSVWHYSNWTVNGNALAFGLATQAFFKYMATGNATSLFGAIQIQSPFLTEQTTVMGSHYANLAGGISHGILQDSTSYTAFTLGAIGGTLTGGTIRVYGYNI